MVIGLIGKSGAGKNVAATILEEKGFYSVDCDRLGHEALLHCREEVEMAFQISLPVVEGKIDRRELASIVFADPNKLHQLESLLYPYITQTCQKAIAEHTYVALNGAKLMESGLYTLCNALFWIEAPQWLRLRRTMKRDGKSKREILSRFSSQKELSPQPWKNMADIYSIRNFGLLSLFRHSIFRTLKKVLKRSQKHEQ